MYIGVSHEMLTIIHNNWIVGVNKTRTEIFNTYNYLRRKDCLCKRWIEQMRQTKHEIMRNLKPKMKMRNPKEKKRTGWILKRSHFEQNALNQIGNFDNYIIICKRNCQNYQFFQIWNFDDYVTSKVYVNLWDEKQLVNCS